MKGCIAHKICGLLVLIGALNWGLIGINPSYNLVHMLLGNWAMVERVVYLLVGLAGIMMIVGCKCKQCKAACGCGEKKM